MPAYNCYMYSFINSLFEYLFKLHSVFVRQPHVDERMASLSDYLFSSFLYLRLGNTRAKHNIDTNTDCLYLATSPFVEKTSPNSLSERSFRKDRFQKYGPKLSQEVPYRVLATSMTALPGHNINSQSDHMIVAESSSRLASLVQTNEEQNKRLSTLATASGSIVRIYCISDTHERHDVLPDLPLEANCDVFIHAGDIFMTNRVMTKEGSIASLKRFNDWLGKQNARHRLVIPGNHDFLFESHPIEELQAILSNATILINQVVEVVGLKIFGTPKSSGRSDNRAFQSAAFGKRVKEAIAEIKDRGETIDILITHGPELAITEEIRPRLAHVFGHVHGYHGVHLWEDLLTLCPCIMNGRYNPHNLPIMIDLSTNRAVDSGKGIHLGSTGNKSLHLHLQEDNLTIKGGDNEDNKVVEDSSVTLSMQILHS